LEGKEGRADAAAGPRPEKKPRAPRAIAGAF
jgi:hypothetical protein